MLYHSSRLIMKDASTISDFILDVNYSYLNIQTGFKFNRIWADVPWPLSQLKLWNCIITLIVLLIEFVIYFH